MNSSSQQDACEGVELSAPNWTASRSGRRLRAILTCHQVPSGLFFMYLSPSRTFISFQSLAYRGLHASRRLQNGVIVTVRPQPKPKSSQGADMSPPQRIFRGEGMTNVHIIRPFRASLAANSTKKTRSAQQR